MNIRPEVTIADKDTIGSFPAEQRECYFNGERNLAYYTFYTVKNCIDECLANLTYQECNCRRHYQPGEDSKPLCGPKEFHCASTIKRKFVGTYKTRCKSCIPTCNEIQYHTETTYTPLQGSEMLWRDNSGNLAPWAHKNVSIVHIYFGEDSTNAKLRKELYGVIDLIANFGGLMGLCLGFSGLSLIELFYFLTLRAWCRIRRLKGERKQQGKKKGRRKSLKRTETTTELIDYEERNCVEIDGKIVEMGSISIGESRESGAYDNRRKGNGISIISKGPIVRTKQSIEAILQSVVVPKKENREIKGVVGEPSRLSTEEVTMNGVNYGYKFVPEQGNERLPGKEILTPIVETELGAPKHGIPPLKL